MLGGLQFGSYAAPNSGMDAFVRHHNESGAKRWTCVAWDTWRIGEGGEGRLGGTLAAYEMCASEALEAFDRATGNPGVWVNSTGDLEARIRQWVELESVRQEAQAAKRNSGGDVLTAVAEIWRQVLGVKEIGLEDNFFDLGGNSLTGLQVVARLKSEFQVRISAVALFEAPTVRALARYLQPPETNPEDRTESA